MAWNGLLRTLNPPLDSDYVSHFQSLADVNIEIRSHGPTAHRLVRRSILEAALGNYKGAFQSADDARFLSPDDPEALYQFGVASLLLAYAEVGALECNRSGTLLDCALPDLLRDARSALRAAVAANAHDHDARAILVQVEDLLRHRRSEATIRQALTGHRRPTRPTRPTR